MKKTDEPSTFSIILDDLAANTSRRTPLAILPAIIYSPGFLAALLFRLMQAASGLPGIGNIVAMLIWRLNVALTGCYFHRNAVIGSGLTLPHPIGLVIGHGVVIGKNVTLYQHCTLGTSISGKLEYPTIGDRCTIYANAVIAGDITIGEGSIVGANSVVLKSVPPESRCAGVPARTL